MDVLICLGGMSYTLTISEKIDFWRGSILHQLFFPTCNPLLVHALVQRLTTTEEPAEHQHDTARKANTVMG